MSIIEGKVNIKLLSGERICTIQRKRLISMVLPLAAYVLIMAMLIVAFIIIFWFYPVFNPLFLIDGVLVMLSFMIVFIMFTTLYWFYQFYAVTNRRILNMHFFRLQGEVFGEVFLSAGAKIKISRVANNLLYNLLNVEDICIQFRREDREEPFILHTPDRPQEIEEILDRITVNGTSSLVAGNPKF